MGVKLAFPFWVRLRDKDGPFSVLISVLDKQVVTMTKMGNTTYI